MSGGARVRRTPPLCTRSARCGVSDQVHHLGIALETCRDVSYMHLDRIAALAARGSIVRVLLAAAMLSSVYPYQLAAQVAPSQSSLIIDVSAARRTSRLEWGVGSVGRIRSQLVYDHLKTSEYRVFLRSPIILKLGKAGLAFEASLAEGSVFGGRADDSDYASSTGQLSQEMLATASGGASTTRTLAIGWYRRGDGHGSRRDISLWVGWTWSNLTVQMQNGVLMFPAAYPIAGLNSEYRARWTGPWIDLQPGVSLGAVMLEARIGLSPRAAFASRGTWNLRPDLAQPKSFEQHGTGVGITSTLSASYAITAAVSVFFGGELDWWTSWRGSDVTYFENGARVESTLRKATLSSRAAVIGTRLAF